MTFSNRGFETLGSAPGLAASWAFGTVSTAYEYAGYKYDLTVDEHAFENFEGEWASNLNYNFEFDQPLTELELAEYDTVGVGDKFVENFEELWTLNHEYLFTLSLLEQAAYDTVPSGFENFENEWTTNESYKFALAPGDLESAFYDFGAQAYEDFEELWFTSYVYNIFSGNSVRADYDVTPENHEDFEEDWTLTMSTV